MNGQPARLTDRTPAAPSDRGRGTLDAAGLDGGTVQLTADRLGRLTSCLAAPPLFPGDDGWDAATAVWNGGIDKQPALVVQPASAAEVAAAVRFAGEHRLLLGIRGGGHNIAGTAIPDGGLLLDMARLREVAVDPAARLARVGPGCRLGEVDRATQEHGLATVLGFVSKTGVAGLTLGGGLGYLTRRFGWTVDNLEEVEIVTADGEIRVASRRENPDLFWALRGGGGNFGAVTRFTFRLHEVGPTVVGGLIAWPFERAAEVLDTYRGLTAAAPRELAVWQVLVHAPPAPFVPPEWHGRPLCAMAVCYTGDLAGAERALAPIRALGEPVFDLIQAQPYVQVQSYLDDTEPDGAHYYWRSEYLSGLSDEFLEVYRELFAECPIPGADLGLLHLAGALQELDAGDGAVGNRDARYALGIKGKWPPGEPRAEEFRRWVRAAGDRVRRYSTGATYINFQTADEGDDRVRATYGANYRRLAEIKAAVDPDNLFRVNRNVRPG